jgi:hypothetical protein
MTAVASVSVACTMTGPTELGSTWLIVTERRVSPSAEAGTSVSVTGDDGVPQALTGQTIRNMAPQLAFAPGAGESCRRRWPSLTLNYGLIGTISGPRPRN